MIVPPSSATCYFTARFQSEQSIQTILNEILDADASDFEMALVVSIDLTNDIEATNYMQAGMEKIEKQLDGITKKVSFNPLYLPVPTEKLVDLIEVDATTGRVTAVADFTDPFVTCNMQLLNDDGDLSVLGKVLYNEFHVVHPIDTSNPSPVPLLS